MKTIKYFISTIIFISVACLSYSCGNDDNECDDPYVIVGTLTGNDRVFEFRKYDSYIQTYEHEIYIKMYDPNAGCSASMRLKEYTTGEISDKAEFLSMLRIVIPVQFISGSVKLTKQKDSYKIEFKDAYFKTEEDFYGRYKDITVNGSVILRNY